MQKNNITTHKISSPGQLLDYVRPQKVRDENGAVVKDKKTGEPVTYVTAAGFNVEFDIGAKPTGKHTRPDGKHDHWEHATDRLIAGHPVDVRGDGRNRAFDPVDFIDTLSDITPDRVVFDVKPHGSWIPAEGRAPFLPGALETLGQQLPLLLQRYLAQKAEDVESEVVVASTEAEFFEAMQEQGVEFPEGVKTRIFARDASENPFAEAEALGVDQVGLQFPPQGKREDKATYFVRAKQRLQELKEMAALTKYADFTGVSMYTINDTRLLDMIDEVFGEGVIEVISDSAIEMEQHKKEQAEAKVVPCRVALR